jgi:outer membrane protein OmpA-like peptidoglycan-associated protein
MLIAKDLKAIMRFCLYFLLLTSFLIIGCASNAEMGKKDIADLYEEQKQELQELKRKMDTQNRRLNHIQDQQDSFSAMDFVNGGLGITGEFDTLAINEINFGVNDFHLKKDDLILLDEIADLMAKNPSSELVVIGHCDKSGSAYFNMQLSELRARSAIRYLVEKYDVPLQRMNALGFGFELLKYDDNNRVDLSKNRRIEIQLLIRKTLSNISVLP